MSTASVKLGSQLIKEYFGPVIQKVHDSLVYGPSTLKLIVGATELPLGIVKKSLCILIQYGFVEYRPGKVPTVAEYILLPDKILLLIRYPRYLTLIEDLFGNEAKVIVEEILKAGSLSTISCLKNSWDRLKEIEAYKKPKSFATVINSFQRLIMEQFVKRCPLLDSPEGDQVPQAIISEDDNDIQKPPTIDRKIMVMIEAGENIVEPSDRQFWKINFKRFHQDMRDEVMVKAIRKRFDEHAGNFMETVIKQMYLRTEAWAAQSNPVPIIEVRDSVEKKKRDSYLIQYMDQYIKVIEDDACSFIRRCGEGSSGSVSVNLASAFRSLAFAVVENIVDQRFGPKAARIFRLVKAKKYIDQEQLQKLAMIPDKEAKQLTYRLVQENFLHLQELKKSASTGPIKNFYLFHIEFNQVVHTVLQICYKAVYNALIRANHEHSENIRLIEKHDKLTSVISSLRESGKEEEYIQQLMEEWISPPEKTLFDSVKMMLQKLSLAELQIDETIFLLQLYTFYDSATFKEKATTKSK